EDPVGRDPHGDEQVTGRTPGVTGCPLALEPDPLAVLDPRRDPGLDRAARPAPAGAVTGRARLVVDDLAAVALRAGLVHREPAAHVVHHHAGAAAGRADVRLGARLAAGAATGLARRLRGQPQRD